MTARRSEEVVLTGNEVVTDEKYSLGFELHYNLGGEMIKIVRKTRDGDKIERQIVDPDITDYVVEKIVEYGPWRAV